MYINAVDYISGLCIKNLIFWTHTHTHTSAHTEEILNEMPPLSAEYRNAQRSLMCVCASVCVRDAINNSTVNKMGQYAHSRNSGAVLRLSLCGWVNH